MTKGHFSGFPFKCIWKPIRFYNELYDTQNLLVLRSWTAFFTDFRNYNLTLDKYYETDIFLSIKKNFFFFFFLIGKQKTIIKEKIERVQVVHDDEQLEKRTKNTTKEAIRKLS